MNDELDTKIDISINGKKIKADNLWDIVCIFEKALKNASLLDSGDSLEILSREASAVASKCGY